MGLGRGRELILTRLASRCIASLLFGPASWIFWGSGYMERNFSKHSQADLLSKSDTEEAEKAKLEATKSKL